VAGRKRLDVIEERIARAERAQQGDAFERFLRTLTDRQITEFRARLERGENPETVAKDFLR
jgi:hypothetical protein